MLCLRARRRHTTKANSLRYEIASVYTRGEFAPLRDRLRLHKWKMVLIGTFYAIPFIALGVAFRLAPIAYVGSLKRLAILIVVFGAVWYLREKVSMLRI